MKDPVQGEVYVLSCSDSGATLTARGPELPATTVRTEDVPKDRSKWPEGGQTLRATIDRADPTNIEVDWEGPRQNHAPPAPPPPPAADAAPAAAQAPAQPPPQASIDAAGASGVDVNELQKKFPGAQIDVTTESWNAMQGGGSLSEQIKAAMEVAQQFQQAAGQMQAPGTPDTASIASAGAAAAHEVDDTLAQLEKLVELRDGGVLTDAEFETAKKKILEG